jgi:hypothetical protein
LSYADDFTTHLKMTEIYMQLGLPELTAMLAVTFLSHHQTKS